MLIKHLRTGKDVSLRLNRFSSFILLLIAIYNDKFSISYVLLSPFHKRRTIFVFQSPAVSLPLVKLPKGQSEQEGSSSSIPFP